VGKKQKREKVVFCCIGMRRGTKKVLHVYREASRIDIGEGEISATLGDDERCYSKPLTGGRPGALWEFERPSPPDSEGTVYTSNAKYVGQYQDQKTVVGWQTEHDAARVADLARKRMEKETRPNRVMECLEPIREVYRRSRGLERQIIIAQVVAYITKG
jgi:hypothetical protein